MNEIDVNFISSVLGLYDDLEDQGIILVYVGKFTHKITKMFTALTEDETDYHNESKTLKRRLHHSVVEILQNMTKHSTELFTEVKFGKGMFLLGKKHDTYYIYTANKIQKSEVNKLSTAIDLVNSSTQEELRELYKKQLRDGMISVKGGAGLGLIDIARKTGNILQYFFLPIDDLHEYFIFKVEVDSRPFQSDEKFASEDEK
jgi:hypothetical protein